MVETNNIYAVIGYVLSSCYRRQVLNAIMAGTKKSRDIADNLGFKRRAVTKAIKELTNKGLVVADGRKYSITEAGMEVITRINDRGWI